MPVIGEYKGIIFKMYFEQEEHNPPHVHAFYSERSAVIFILDPDKSFGDLKSQQMKDSKDWVRNNKERLMEIWSTQCFTK